MIFENVLPQLMQEMDDPDHDNDYHREVLCTLIRGTPDFLSVADFVKPPNYVQFLIYVPAGFGMCQDN